MTNARLKRLCLAAGIVADTLGATDRRRGAALLAGRYFSRVGLSQVQDDTLAALLADEPELDRIHGATTAKGLLKELLCRIEGIVTHNQSQAKGGAKRRQSK